MSAGTEYCQGDRNRILRQTLEDGTLQPLFICFDMINQTSPARMHNDGDQQKALELINSCWSEIKNDRIAIKALGKLRASGCRAVEILLWVELYRRAGTATSKQKRLVSSFNRQARQFSKRIDAFISAISKVDSAWRELVFIPKADEDEFTPIPPLLDYKKSLANKISLCARSVPLVKELALLALVNIVTSNVKRPHFRSLADLLSARTGRVIDVVTLTKAGQRIHQRYPQLSTAMARETSSMRGRSLPTALAALEEELVCSISAQ